MLTAAAQESLTYRLCHHNKDTQQKHHFGLTDGIEGIVMDLFRQKTFSLDSYIGWVGYACQRRGVGAPFRCGWALRKQSAHMNNKQVARCFCFNISSSSSGWLLLLLWIFISFFFFFFNLSARRFWMKRTSQRRHNTKMVSIRDDDDCIVPRRNQICGHAHKLTNDGNPSIQRWIKRNFLVVRCAR